jgi:glycosyltransferase involved in cell wall biosynthesis
VFVSVCIPSVRPETLGFAVASVLRQQHSDWELLVMGQGDHDSLRAAVAAVARGDTRVTYVALDRRGTCAARNAGVERSSGQVVAFMDDDCEAADDWLTTIVSTFAEHPQVGLVAGALVRPPGLERRFSVCPEMIPLDVLYEPRAGSVSPVGFGAAGANISVRRDVLDRVGGFDEMFGPGASFASTEDTDYILRCESAGVAMYARPSVVMHHTYGYRFGIGATYRLMRSYAMGNGVLAAKLTLVGDPRGRMWLEKELQAALVEPIRQLRPHRLLRRVLRYVIYLRSYRACLRACTTSSTQLATALLIPRSPVRRLTGAGDGSEGRGRAGE